jgi:putative ABC transport system permease protein
MERRFIGKNGQGVGNGFNLNVDRSQPVYSVQPLTTVASDSFSPRRFSLLRLAFFAAAALFLASLGLYGVMSYVVVQRTAEIGIGMALGAERSQVLRLVQRQGLALALAGLAIGAIGSLLLTRLLRSLVFHVAPQDRWTLGVAAVTTGGVVVGLLSAGPARRWSGSADRAAV